MRLSIVIVTHNRREALRTTLGVLAGNPHLPHDSLETLVVDNGSTDGASAMLASEFPRVAVIRRPKNEGVSARNHAFTVARGEYVMLCDDDSYPLGDSAERAMAHLDREPRVAAVVGRIELPNGALEASALPTVVANGALIIRRRVIEEVGGLPREFFRQAEEYDWSLRIWNAGHRIDRFEDVVFRHDKAPGNRRGSDIHYCDVRNNLILLERYLPAPLRGEYRRDWTQRYGALARKNGHRAAHLRGLLAGRAWAVREAASGRRLLSPAATEHVFDLDWQAGLIAEWARAQGVSRVLLADLGKNIYATWRGCTTSGVTPVGVADNGDAFAGLTYRRLPVRRDEAWARQRFDGVVLANTNPAQVERREAELRQAFPGRPVLTLWQPRRLGPTAPALVRAA